MKEFLVDFFANNANFILFLHVVSAMVWVGGMIAIRLAVHPAMMSIEKNKLRMNKTLLIMQNFFKIVRIFIGILLVTAVFLSVGLGFKAGDPSLYVIVHIKESIWLVMTILFIIMYIKRNKAEKYFLSGDMDNAKAQLAPLAKWMIPVNIVLGLIALALGGTLRGF